MDATLTLILLIASIAVVVFSGWRGARPTDITRGPRMMPWRFIMQLAAALVFALTPADMEMLEAEHGR